VDESELEHRLRAAAVVDPQPAIHVRGDDRKVDDEHVIRVMADAQRAGVTTLGFITDPGA